MSKFTKCHNSHRPFLKNINWLSDGIFSKAPELTGIRDMRIEKSMVDIDESFSGNVVSEFGKNTVSTYEFDRKRRYMWFPV